MQRLEFLTVVFTTALPGLGKTTMIEGLRDRFEAYPGASVRVLTSDDVRTQSKKKYREENNTEGMDEYKIETKAKVFYNILMEHSLETMFQELKNCAGKSVFILDKNYVSPELRNLIISKAKQVSENPLIVTILPNSIMGQDALNIEFQEDSVAYTFDVLYCSFIRCFQRKNHPTMNFGAHHMYKSIVNCLRSFVGSNFEQLAVQNNMKLLRYDYFSVEKANNEEIVKKLVNILEKIKSEIETPTIEDGQGDRVSEIVKSDEELVKLFTEYDKAVCQQRTDAAFQSLLDLMEEHFKE